MVLLSPAALLDASTVAEPKLAVGYLVET